MKIKKPSIKQALAVLMPFVVLMMGGICRAEEEKVTQPAYSVKFSHEIKSDDTDSRALNQPAGIDVSDAGEIYVADTVNSRVVIFDDAGQIKKVFGKLGEGTGDLNVPMALAVDTREKKIYVADSSNYRIVVFTLEGEFIQSIDLNKDKDEKENKVRPIGIAASKDGRIYVADADNSLIRVFSPKGELLSKFGGFGAEDGKFVLPVGLCIDKRGRLAVVDMNNSRVQFFDGQNKFLSKIGRPGDTKGCFGKPKDVAVDDEGFAYVSDGANLVVHVFDNEGKFVDVIGADKDPNLQFAAPFGVCVRKNQLYVTDRWRNSIRVYEVSR